ncbi:hypothetical protein [Marinospirillum alkaliphilum]|uniref:Uncharacterized protein n=1 Tax=Marinospirillum alkaliphilum DSM 21637 TaxID=1122209 RepID=A0A1K1VET5_9GAMM|nr:hypothetical protein [Marinospirillum alkaliphilum]SFX23085.1 hypothetical protein SAMN02745752_00909 [Marinospirillum alkaliphilum DSM 21637]
MKPRLLLMATLLLGFLAGWWLNPGVRLPEASLLVEFENASDQLITSLKLDFGHASGQSSLLALRLAPGEKRSLFLNHPPAAGFNVLVSYADGLQQDFCANRGTQGQQQRVILRR